MDFIGLQHIMPFLIPIVAIVMSLGIGMLAIWVDYRKKRDMFELHHKERLVAIERGMEIPPLPPEFFGGARSWRSPVAGDYLRRGLLWGLVGLGIGIALWVNRSLETATWALIPMGVGLANLAFYAADGRQRRATGQGLVDAHAPGSSTAD